MHSSHLVLNKSTPYPGSQDTKLYLINCLPKSTEVLTVLTLDSNKVPDHFYYVLSFVYYAFGKLYTLLSLDFFQCEVRNTILYL